MNEAEIERFWAAHPCGDALVGGLDDRFGGDEESFFESYDRWRYGLEHHIPACLDGMHVNGQRVLEIGLGQGAESEQLIRRGAHWSGLDLTRESVDRVRRRLSVHDLPYDDVRVGSALDIPWPDDSFDIVFSHGVLHHVPDIVGAQAEIHRVLKPGGKLVVMLYARRSLNYLVSIAVVRRLALLAVYPLARLGVVQPKGIVGQHVQQAQEAGLRKYLRLEQFTHRSTDGPESPFARVYDLADVERDFPSFRVERSFKRFMHAPPLPVHKLPGASLMGWHLWVELAPRALGTARAASRAGHSEIVQRSA
jgi:SAM-dependent methyltransferase